MVSVHQYMNRDKGDPAYYGTRYGTTYHIDAETPAIGFGDGGSRTTSSVTPYASTNGSTQSTTFTLATVAEPAFISLLLFLSLALFQLGRTCLKASLLRPL